jgi:hypothetical protein
MKTTTIDMRPEPFEPPFFYTQLDTLAKHRLNLWQKHGRTLGEGSIFAFCDSGMVKDYFEDGTATDLHPAAGYPKVTKHLEYALHRAKDFIEYHERHADKHGGLNLDDCHEWGNAQLYDGGKNQPRSLSYGIRLSFNDGSILFFTITSRQESEL